MALFRATVRTSRTTNGIRIEKGMSVDFASVNPSPLYNSSSKEVVDAFQHKYGIDLHKVEAANSTHILVVKIG